MAWHGDCTTPCGTRLARPGEYGRRPMQMDFGPRDDFENFLQSEVNTMSGLSAPAHDHFEAGLRIVNALYDELAQDLVEIDLDDLY